MRMEEVVERQEHLGLQECRGFWPVSVRPAVVVAVVDFVTVCEHCCCLVQEDRCARRRRPGSSWREACGLR